MFSLRGGEPLAGVTQRGRQFGWVVFELATGIAGAFPLDTQALKNVLP